MVDVLLACQTQWRVGFVGATGLDYTAVAVCAKALGVEFTPYVLRGVALCERLTLEAWAKERKKEQP